MKFILRLGGPCCEYPLFKIKLSLGSENFVDLNVNESYKNHAVIITPKEGYSANKMSITVNGKTITPENGVFSFIMPSGNVNIVVTDTRNDLEKVQDLLTFAGYTTNQSLFTDGTYIWMEGANSSSLKKAIIFADNTNCINVVTAGASGEEVVSQLSSVTKTKDLGQRVTLLRNINSYDYYMPDYVTSFIGESITIVDIYNGHDYVDLGLPSGTKWATVNIKLGDIVSNETDYGDYRKFAEGASTGTMESIELSNNDVVTFEYGKIWHIPTAEQLRELINNTTYAWVTNYQNSGINGGTWTANGQTLFIPAAGMKDSESLLHDEGSVGYIWSASKYDIYASYLLFDNTESFVNLSIRENKYSIRGVID